MESLLPPDFAGEYTVRKWTLDDGLPDSLVCGVVPGRDGYLWLATARFLVRFDGLRFLPVTMPAQASAGRNEGLFQDSRGGLWVYGYLGAVRYDVDGSWWQGELAGMPRGRVMAVAQGADGTVYLAQERVIYAWRDGGAHPVLEASAFPEEDGRFRRLAWDSGGGALWIAAGTGLYHWSPDGRKPSASLPDIRTEWLLSSAAGQPLVAHGSFACLRQAATGWERLPEVRSVTPKCLLELPDGALWVGHDAGVDIFREKVWHTQTKSVLHGSSCVLSIAADLENNIWLATTGGLFRLRRRILSGIPLRGKTEDPGISVLWVEPEGQIWAGLRSGGLATGDADGLEALLVPPDFSDVAINALYREANGTLWCGGSGGSLWTLQNQSLQRIEGVHAEEVRAILGAGGVPSWVATRRGVLSYNAERDRLVEMAWPMDPVLALWQDDDGVLWVGHESRGLVVLRSDKKEDSFLETGIPGRTIQALYRDAEGVLWIGGLSGLARWDEGGRFVFRRSHGLWNESIRQIAEDACGFLWLGSAGGVMRIAKRDLEDVAHGRKELLAVRTFGTEAGMEQEACTGGVFFPAGKPPRDRLWFPTRAGLLSLKTDLLPFPRPAPKIRLTMMERGRLTEIRAPAGMGTEVRLMDQDNPRDVRVEYTALDFATPERVRFRYELAGPYAQRSDLTEERQAVFSRLPPGDYTFRVTACNGDGVWHPEGVSASWTVRPFFWETSLFRMLCLLLGGGCVAWAVRANERRRVRVRLAAAERERSMALERTRIARDLHDEIGAKLTRLSLLGAMAAEDAAHEGALCGQIEEMACTARETHRAFDEIIWSVSPRNDTLRSLSHYICKYAEEFFAGTPVRCTCALPEVMQDKPVDPQSRHHFFLAVKESLHNALKHAGAKQVSIRVGLSEKTLRVEVSDDGCGFEPAAAGTQGEGLRNMQERMRAIGGELRLSSRAGRGTRLVFEMPVEQTATRGKGDPDEKRRRRSAG